MQQTHRAQPRHLQAARAAAWRLRSFTAVLAQPCQLQQPALELFLA